MNFRTFVDVCFVVLTFASIWFAVKDSRKIRELEADQRTFKTAEDERAWDMELAADRLQRCGKVQSVYVLSRDQVYLAFDDVAFNSLLIPRRALGCYLTPGQKFYDATSCNQFKPIPEKELERLHRITGAVREPETPKPPLWIDQKPIGAAP